MGANTTANYRQLSAETDRLTAAPLQGSSGCDGLSVSMCVE